MKLRLMLAALSAFLIIALAGATGASALIGLGAITTSSSSSQAGGNGNGGNHDTTKTQTYDCDQDADDDDRYVTYAGPEYMWPPNHKYRDLTIAAFGKDGEQVTLTVTGTHDEMVDGEELQGSGNTENDAVGPDNDPVAANTGAGSATVPYRARAERSGTGDGRLYTFDVVAEFGNDPLNTCETTFTSFVPHDQRGHENKPSKGKRSKKARRARR